MDKTDKNIILKKYLENKHSLKEWTEIKEWFGNDTDYKDIEAILRHKVASNNTTAKEDQQKVDKLFDKIASHIWLKDNRRKKVAPIRYIVLRVAAALVIGLFIGLYINSLSTPKEPSYYSAFSPKGSVSQMLLPDGSVIFLNAGSKIKYSIDGQNGNREVFLNGEAWFEVAKNKDKPFVVRTPYYNVNVTGTKFNVKAYDNDNNVTTTLEEGQIIIASSEKVKLAENVVLKPGEQVILDKTTNSVSVKHVDTRRFTSWKDNKLILVDMNLKDFVVILQRKYDVEIKVSDEKILDMHVNCTIKNESIIEILDIIKKALPISYEIIGQEIVIKTSN